MQNAANNALILTAARFNVDDILTRDMRRISGRRSASASSDLAEREHLGVAIDKCRCRCKACAPRQLKDVFALVTTARQNHDKLLNDATGEAEPHLEPGRRAGHVHHQRRRIRAHATSSPPSQSDAEAFTELLPQYQSNPNLSRNWSWPRPCRRC